VNRVQTLDDLERNSAICARCYSHGCDAPGATESAAVVNQVYHHALLAHGYAVEAVREYGGKRACVRLVHNPPAPVPVTETAADIAAARTNIHGTLRNSWDVVPR